MTGWSGSLSLLAHVAAITLPAWWALRRYRLPLTVLFPTVFLLLWSAMVIGGGLLALLGKLGSLKSFCFTTTLAGLVQAGLLLWLAPRQTDQPPPWDSLPTETNRWQRILRRYLILAFGVTLPLLAFNGWNHGPMVEDNLTCKLMRGFYFLQNGNFAPDATNPDSRIFGVPPYVSLLQCLVLAHHPPLGFLNLLGTSAWTCLACGIYRLSGLCGATRLGGVVAAWLACFSSCLLLQGSSENDDILASLPSVWFFPFMIHSVRRESLLSGCLAGVCFALGVGSKLFPLLFAPMLLVGGVWWAWRCRGLERLRLSAALRRTVFAGAVAAVMAGLSFAYYNTLYTGSPVKLPALVSDIQNRPFSASAAAQNFSAQSASAMTHGMTHLAAVLADRGFITRDAWTHMTNGLTASLEGMLAWGGHELRDAWGERFRLTPPATEGLPLQQLFGDTSIWHGFLPWLLLPAGIWCLVTRTRIPWVARWMPLLALCWFGAYCASNKFILDIGRYFITPVSVAMPAIALFWDRFTMPGASRGIVKWLPRTLFVVVGTFTLLLLWPTINESRYRRLTDATRRVGKPLPVMQTSRRLHDSIAKAKSFNVINTWQLPLFALAAHAGDKPRMKVSAPFDPEVLELTAYAADYPAGLANSWPWGLAGVPVEERLAPGAGFIWLGRLITGFEVWGTGMPAQRKHSPGSGTWNCAMFRLAKPDKNNPELVITPFFRGAAPGLEFQASPGHAERPSGVWVTTEARVNIPEGTGTATLFVRFPMKPDACYRKEVQVRTWQNYSLRPEKVALELR